MIAVDMGPQALAIANYADVKQTGHTMMGGVIQLVDISILHSITLTYRSPGNVIAC